MDDFQSLRSYINHSYFEQVDTSSLSKKERLAASNKNKRAQFLDKTITQIDEQIKEGIRLSKNYISDLSHRAYLVDSENDKEALFINGIKNFGSIDFYRNGTNIRIYCKHKSGKSLFYLQGELFEKLTDTQWLVISKGQGNYKASSSIGDKSNQMKTDDKYYKSQSVFYDKMIEERAILFKKFFANN